VKRWIGAVVSVAIGVVMLEGGLQVIDVLAHRFPSVSVLHRIDSFLAAPPRWEQMFVERYRNGVTIYESLHVSHPTRGWALIPDRHIVRNGLSFTTNHAGFRSTHEFVNDDNRYQVVIVGDSFTFGDGIDDGVTWPHLIEQTESRHNLHKHCSTRYGD
jgi:hypothetical protein